MAITDTWLKATNGKGIGIVVERTDRDGLGVRISAKGKLTFQLRYRYDGKAQRIDIGSYPKTSLKEARAEAFRLKTSLEKNENPKVIKQLEKQVVYNDPSFNSLFAEWYQKECVHDVQDPHAIKRSFELYVLPKFGKLPMSKITLTMWMNLLDDLADKVPSIASRLLTQTKKLYVWANIRQLVTGNPLIGINAKGQLKIERKKGSRVLSNDEIKTLWVALQFSGIAPQYKLLTKLCLFYGCRVGELRNAKYQDFDFEEMTWTIQPEGHKTGKKTEKPIIRPIIPEIVPTLEEVFEFSDHKELIFTKIRTNRPLSASAHLDIPRNLMNWIKGRYLKKGETMKDWSMHDLRRTMRTNMSSITSRHVAEIMVGHKQPEIEQVYDHYHYLDEQRQAYTHWFDYIESLVGEF